MSNASETREALPPDLTIDDPRNWNFDGVPSDELEVCCWWEYARESAFIRSVHQRSIDGNPSCGSMARIQGYGKYPWLIVDRFFGLGQFPLPWQQLSKRDRRKGVLPANADKPHPFGRGHWVETIKIRQLVDEYLAHLTPEMWRRLRPEDEPSSFCDETEGYEVGVFRIYWRFCTNEEIVQGFARWVNARRRPGVFRLWDERPRGAFSVQPALDGLAIMRLLHHYTPSQLRMKGFKVWERNPQRQLQARSETVKRFKRMYPFGEPSLSGETQGGRNSGPARSSVLSPPLSAETRGGRSR